MQLSVDRKELLSALSLARKVPDNRSTLPILNNALLSIENGHLNVLATDLDLAVKSRVGEIDNLEEGKITVNARKIFEVVKALGDDAITLRQKDEHLHVTSGRSRFKLKTLSPEDYPSVPTPSDPNPPVYSSGPFVDLIDKVLFAASVDETRYTLTGVLMEIVGDGSPQTVRMVATDGYRMSKCERVLGPDLQMPEGGSIILPARGLHAFRRLAMTREQVFMQIEGDTIFAGSEGVLYSMRSVAGKFPEWQGVLPQKIEKSVTLDPEEFTDVITRVGLMSPVKQPAVMVSVELGKVTVSASDMDAGDASEDFPVSYEGEPFAVNLNTRLLRECLNALVGEAQMGIPKDGRPVVFTTPSDPSFVHIIMPLRV